MLTFSNSFYRQFLRASPNMHLRIGQSFHQWAGLEKVTNPEDKMWCDQLYEKDGVDALDFIESRLDYSQ